MPPFAPPLPKLPGSYALILAPDAPRELPIGRLGLHRFDAPYYLYTGSALGSGGIAGRLRHHLRPVTRPHWHVDRLRQWAEVVEVWTACDPRRLECAWARAAGRLRGARIVSGFGASDCACEGHLVSLPRRPTRRRLRHHLLGEPLLAEHACPPIARFEIARQPGARSVRSRRGERPGGGESRPRPAPQSREHR